MEWVWRPERVDRGEGYREYREHLTRKDGTQVLTRIFRNGDKLTDIVHDTDLLAQVPVSIRN